MTKQEGPERETPARKPDEEIADPTNKPEAKATRKHGQADEQEARLKAELAAAQKTLATTQAEIEQERQKLIEAEKDLTKAQQDLAATRLEVEQERRAQRSPEKARTEAETALNEANLGETVVEESMKTLSPMLGEGGTNPRVSFIVRLTIDEHGQPGRGEIEHEPSHRKQKFPSLNGEGLVAFMKECVITTTVPEHSIPAAPPPEKVEASTPAHPRLASSLIISDVKAFRQGTPGVGVITFSSAEAFEVQAPFRLQGSEVHSLTAQEASYEMTVKVIEVTSGKSQVTRAHNGKLRQDKIEYAPQVEVPGLRAGTYRLFAQVILNSPTKMVGYYDKTMIEVN